MSKGLLDLVVKQQIYERLWVVPRREHLLVASGVVQKALKIPGIFLIYHIICSRVRFDKLYTCAFSNQ